MEKRKGAHYFSTSKLDSIDLCSRDCTTDVVYLLWTVDHFLFLLARLRRAYQSK